MLHSDKLTVRRDKRHNEDEMTRTIKDKRLHLQQLQRENLEFRGIIQTHKNKDGKASFNPIKELQSLYEKIQCLEVKEDSEAKKYTLLDELIQYLQQELVRDKKQQDMDSSLRKATLEKELKKQEYDVEQILQKCNEQVARINVLRERVAISRSERVVYSSMFKKLEKEIRSYEEQFKQLLITSSSLSQKKSQLIASPTISVVKRKAERQVVSLQLQSEDSFQETTNIENTTQVRKLKKKKSNFCTNQVSSRFSGKARELVAEGHETYKIFFQRLLVDSQSGSYRQMMQEFKTIGQQNSRLFDTIEQLSKSIHQAESCLQSGQLPRQNDFAQPTIETIELFTNTDNHSTKEEELRLENQNYQSTLVGLASLLGIQTSCPVQINGIFTSIDSKVGTFVELFPMYVSRVFDEETGSKRGEESEHLIENTIERMQRYHQSERIFNKRSFQEEFSKETSRIRKITKPRR